ncbi:MAG: efflux RND transporter periplasmic adaptor subunit [Deltaproteobacteria bacterium]|nr:efflux RND transporter periplasmic adaptor subunit [Deltaproteobacteria bacterium]MBW2359565.1 efflux RND transporter periplasmic adaptor subunit [Deltaproteobacteria bacterium]
MTRVCRALAVSLACVAAVLVACGQDAPPPEPVVRPIKILELGGDEGAGEVLEFPGTVAAAETARLAFEVPGKLQELPVTEGQEVAAGALLASLDPRDYQAEVDAQEAKRAEADVELRRAKQLLAADVISRQELDVKQRNFDVANARVEQASKALEDTRLLAPFAGIVARTDVDNFETVQAKQPVLVFENDGAFDVSVSIPEQDAARFRSARSLAERTRRSRPEVEMSAIPGRRFAARVSEFSTTADPATRTFTATFRFENPGDLVIRSGMTAKVSVHLSGEDAAVGGLLVPSVATAADASGAAYVWVVDPQSLAVARTSVALGEFSGDSVHVRSGLSGDEWIAVSGVNHLREGMVVRRLDE